MALSNPRLRASVTWRVWGMRVIAVYLLVVFALTVRNGFEAVAQRHGWMIGDWLINYQGGFVRRGLMGEIALDLSRLLAVNPDKIVLAVQLFSYAVFFGFSWLLLRRQKDLFPYLLLVFSPYIFMFQIRGFEGGFRKEILFLAVMAFCTWAAKTLPQKHFERWFFVLLLLFPALILSHEVLAIWLPLLLIIYLATVPLDKKRVILLLLFLSLSGAAFVFSMLYRGDANIAAAVAYSLFDAGYMNLSTAIRALSKSPDDGMALLRRFMERGSYLVYYPQALLLAGLAFYPVRARLKILLRLPYLALIAISLIGSAIVMSVSVDWGRFFYALLVALFLLTFLSNEDTNPPERSNYKMGVWVLLVLVYSVFWFLPHSGFANPYIWRVTP